MGKLGEAIWAMHKTIEKPTKAERAEAKKCSIDLEAIVEEQYQIALKRKRIQDMEWPVDKYTK